MQVVHDEYLVYRCWIVTCDQGRIQGWWTGGRGRGAAGAERVGFGEGVSSPQRGRGLGGGCAHFP